MNRKVSQVVDLALTVIGALLILSSVAISGLVGAQIKVLLTVIGLMFTYAGFHGLSLKLTPSDRKFNALRQEGDKMISLIRHLNRAALAMKKGELDDSQFNSTLKEMHDSVRMMAKVAALEVGESLVEQSRQNFVSDSEPPRNGTVADLS